MGKSKSSSASIKAIKFFYKIFRVSDFSKVNKIFPMLAQNFLKILLASTGKSSQLFCQTCKLATYPDTSVWRVLLSVHSVHVYIVNSSLLLLKVVTHLRRGNTVAVWGCLCSDSVDSAPTRVNCLMRCADQSVSCWYIKAKQQARPVSIGARCTVNMRSPH